MGEKPKHIKAKIACSGNLGSQDDLKIQIALLRRVRYQRISYIYEEIFRKGKESTFLPGKYSDILFSETLYQAGEVESPRKKSSNLQTPPSRTQGNIAKTEFSASLAWVQSRTIANKEPET